MEWNRLGERVEAVSALLYDELVIQESRGAAPDAEAAAELLAQKALEAGIDRFVDRETLDEFVARVQFAGFEPPDIPQALKDLCLGLRSFAELKNAATNLVALLEQTMIARRLEQIAPTRIRLPNGRQTKVHYEPRQAAVDCIPLAGLFRHAGNAADRAGADTGGGPPAGAQSAGGANYF